MNIKHIECPDGDGELSIILLRGQLVYNETFIAPEQTFNSTT